MKELCHGLSNAVNKLENKDPNHGKPIKDNDTNNSLQQAMQLHKELEGLGGEASKTNSVGSELVKVSPRLADNACGKSLPPHLRKKVAANGLNGHQDPSGPAQQVVRAQPGPRSPAETAKPFESTQAWKPHFIATLAALPNNVLCNIPRENMVSFHPDFIKERLGGMAWSPGLWFINEQGPCILKNRTYYLLDPNTEPFVPKEPGEHGAKLTAFFNKAPEEEFGDLFDEDSNSYENVPMFVMVNGRYVYFGNYSQTRWSDKIDYDTLKDRVPDHVKEFWATELTSSSREEWVTEELQKHFFKKPEYEGRLYAAPVNGTTIDTEMELKQTEQMEKDIKQYLSEIREWEREAKMKTAMIKKDLIMTAFDNADAADPPGLRLWWEYLECVDWKKDLYDLLVTLQSRSPGKYLD